MKHKNKEHSESTRRQTTIRLPEDQYRLLKTAAGWTGRSAEEIISEALDAHLPRVMRDSNAPEVVIAGQR